MSERESMPVTRALVACGLVCGVGLGVMMACQSTTAPRDVPPRATATVLVSPSPGPANAGAPASPSAAPAQEASPNPTTPPAPSASPPEEASPSATSGPPEKPDLSTEEAAEVAEQVCTDLDDADDPTVLLEAEVLDEDLVRLDTDALIAAVSQTCPHHTDEVREVTE